MKTEIIYEDKDILVIYKPAGLATQTAKLGQADVVSELKGYLARAERESERAGRAKGQRELGEQQKNGGRQKPKGGNSDSPYLGVIHRLDQPVEGLLVFAKNKKAAGDLTAQLQKQGREVGLHKHYYALLCGKPSEKSGELVDYMYKSPENVAVIVENEGDLRESVEAKGHVGENAATQAKEARLRYKILSELALEESDWNGKAELLKDSSEKSAGLALQGQETHLALADIQILTGRFHQIRAQMAHANLPLLGDLKYGNAQAKNVAQALGVRNVALCAYSLEFVHPATKRKLSFQIKPRGIAFSFCGAHEK